ncbi:hypothetical protein EV44_g5918 [Erysiphe necator]|uniref:Uncharacterized protein n=1 Tax=Uncinula necator TaxID=52586 RepID=A0A0B1P3H9_UNCNE|nr:hypothetical protein EV44_g5918 [Erysiphe necator]
MKRRDVHVRENSILPGPIVGGFVKKGAEGRVMQKRRRLRPAGMNRSPEGKDCANLLGYLRHAEHTGHLHRHRVKVKISTLPAYNPFGLPCCCRYSLTSLILHKFIRLSNYPIGGQPA